MVRFIYTCTVFRRGGFPLSFVSSRPSFHMIPSSYDWFRFSPIEALQHGIEVALDWLV
jgi:hypothetical protein